MHPLFRCISFTHRTPSPLWNDSVPVRKELFGIERLELHAESLAVAQPITAKPPKVTSLLSRLNDNAVVLLAAYRASAEEQENDRGVVPAAEWLLDNYHLVEEQIREIRDDLPTGYYRQLPKLAEGPFAGYPRVLGIAWAFVAHTDSHFDPETLRRFLVAYQRVQPLTIGELWAVAITLRIVLIENLRRLADQITKGRKARADAEALANRLFSAGGARSALENDISTRSTAPLSELFAAQLAKRLRDQDPRTTPALGWLEERLTSQVSSIEEVVEHTHQRQGASNVTVRNIINSMRLISNIDWAELFESVSLVDEQLRANSAFASMDFSTRNLYRSAIEQLAQGSLYSELEITEYVLSAAHHAATTELKSTEAERTGDPGYHLIAEGRFILERIIGYRPPLKQRLSRINIRLGIGGYAGTILCLTSILLMLGLWSLSLPAQGVGLFVLFMLFGFIPASEVATALVNRAISMCFGATVLPALELKSGVPESLRTIVAVPTLLTSEADLLEQIERLEVHHLASTGGDLYFALLTDGLDADQENIDSDDHLLAVATKAIAELNQRYVSGSDGDRFLLLHRRRLFNESENKWMGWERKRGKLHEFNQLLRGAINTSFININGYAPVLPPNVRYVITLDADTRLPRDAAVRLVGKMAHPLNRPRFSDDEQRVIGGYAILQPRVTPSLPIGKEGSFYQRTYSGPSGMDPYAAAISDVYQDLFCEGSYTGKGIYDVDAFETALRERVPENILLSHDLFEGVFARAGLASDIEVVEEFPARYDVAAKRQHRWTRGDWQLLPWIFSTGKGNQKLPWIGRWKILDNLRRSLLAPCLLILFGLSWQLPLPTRIDGLFLILAAIAIPLFLPSLFSILPHRKGINFRNHISVLAADLYLATKQTLFVVVFLADQAWRMVDAIARTLFRLFISHRHLLEWTTAAQSSGSPRLDLRGSYQGMWEGMLLGLIMVVVTTAFEPSSAYVTLPFALLWLAAPALALWVSRAPTAAQQRDVSDSDINDFRLTARRTWRFFETFVTPSENMLPPDNFQEDPRPIIAHRTSPTNIGLYLLSTIAARDFGWAGTIATVDRLEATLNTMEKLQKFKGHFFNWYDTQDLRELEPPYISSVDSGNLAGHLIVLANACEEWIDTYCAATTLPGVMDTCLLAREAIIEQPVMSSGQRQQLISVLAEIENELNTSQAIEILLPTLSKLAEKAIKTAEHIVSSSNDERFTDLLFWVEAVRNTIAEHTTDHAKLATDPQALNARLRLIADSARAMALAMDFTFLLDPERKLLSIGYSLTENRLDSSCYDLLASEARLASLFAIAKGDVTTKHWFRLGRTATPIGGKSALISWSGSMFEYLMPSLVIRAPVGSLLEQTNTLVVERQANYGRLLGIPWGISESAYNARDMEFTYQYSNFGVPGLGLKRGLSANVVIAPYATALAAMIDPLHARRNYTRLAEIGAQGRYGFYEALDFTRSRLPDQEDVVIIRSFMAHHQGMTIVALANVIYAGEMRARFHREPIIQACELLLQERMPRNVAIAHPRAEEVNAATTDEINNETPAVRHLSSSSFGAAPITHLLSNGRYAVMLTAVGAGYSRWRDIAITRWREDATRDNYGSFIFMRDIQRNDFWSASLHPIGNHIEKNEVFFCEDRAEYIHHNGKLKTTMDVLISGEDDGEVRRITLTNNGRRSSEIELTSYAELVLTTQSADIAHPAFSKMFVVTEYIAEYGAIIATRRPRSADEPQVWAAHLSVVEGDITAEPQYESDRAQFIGRGNSLNTANAVLNKSALSNTTGTVLDAIFSIRQRVKVPPGKIARIAFWTLVASSKEELLALVDKHHDRNAFDRAKTLAWTQAQVQLRHLGIDTQEAANFQQLAAPILYVDPRFRVPSESIIRGAGAQSGLWQHAISGDLPIVLLRIDDIEDMDQVRQLLRAHEYWRMKRLAVDLVILNERASSYVQDLQVAIATAVRSSQSRPRFGAELAQGSVYELRADLLSLDARTLLQSVARLVLYAHRGSIADQLLLMPKLPIRSRPARYLNQQTWVARQLPTPQNLEFFNGLGGFDKDGKEYVTILHGGKTTPAPWINVTANPTFGFQTSTEGSGYTWAENSRENTLTPWSNDPVTDPAGEAIYVRDETTGKFWTATAQPIRDEGTYIARHGFGYSRFEHQANGIALELLQYVPMADPIKISRLTLRNKSGWFRHLSVSAYIEWVLGTTRSASAPFITTHIDEQTGAMLIRNPWNSAFPNRVVFADLRGQHSAWTASRTEFLGRNGDLATPQALVERKPLSGVTGAGFDPCSVLQCNIELAAEESIEVVLFVGQCNSVSEAQALITRYREMDLDVVLDEVTQHWGTILNTVQVKTPDRAMDIMLNGWLLYQTLACRVWARSAFYQASGAYGFRDQLQDGMALSFARPDETRNHLLRAAARQFTEGDVQHWWLPHTGLGVRTHISDDRVWLAFATATYILSSGDNAILDEIVPFLEGPQIPSGEHDALFQPLQASEQATLFEHCARGLDQCLTLTGKLGLPLIGTGDWNDGMNRVGESGSGESVWLGWLLVRTIDLFAPLATSSQHERASHWIEHAKAVRAAIEQECWDGEWYRRATFDDGSWLGSKDNEACCIDSIAQSWSVLAGATDPQRAAIAMASLEKYLIRHDDGLVLLFSPPFDQAQHDPGYIMGYPPGLRENGGQYSHAAMWAILAFTKLGHGDKSHNLFSLLNPINHTLTPEALLTYKVEPYVIAADVYSVLPHIGRGGWTWYTGAAGWMYRAGIEGILGINREGASLVIKPCIPADWPEFNATIKIASTFYKISVENPSFRDTPISYAMLDGTRIHVTENGARVPLDGNKHTLEVFI